MSMQPNETHYGIDQNEPAYYELARQHSAMGSIRMNLHTMSWLDSIVI